MSRQVFTIEVTQLVRVTLDDEKLDDSFLIDFRDHQYPFFTLSQHAEHIAQLQARGVIDIERTPEFVEGYGKSDEMGITATVVETEVQQVKP